MGAVLITGTSSGIGEACVKRLSESGWKVYAGVRHTEDGERLLASLGGDVVPVILDVTNLEQIHDVLARIDADVGSLDGLVNNAGIGVGGVVETLSDDDWRWQMEVNFFSLVRLTRLAMPLVDKAGGRFVHIGSVAGRVGIGGLGPYAASKHAVSAFNWSLRCELGRNTKMRSSVVEPGAIKTAIWDKATVTVSTFDAEMTGPLRDRYGFILDFQRGFVDEGARRGVDAGKVAKAVEHALTARRPKARYLVGPDAKATGVIARMPDRAREGFINMNSRRLERVGRRIAAKR